MTDDSSLDDMTSAVITVNEGGRGFIVRGRNNRLVITAAHCLPFVPPAVSFSFAEERTYAALLAPLGQQPAIMAECLFVDPVADIALLGPPDDDAAPDELDAYEELVDAGEVPGDLPTPISKGLRDAFWGAMGAYSHWHHRQPEPEVSLGQQPTAIGLICDLVSRQDSPMPDSLWRHLEMVAGRAEELPDNRSYKSGARFLRRLIKERRALFDRLSRVE